jgi:ABC-type transporter MlaC component
MKMLQRQALASTIFVAIAAILPNSGRADPVTEASAALSELHAELMAIVSSQEGDASRVRALLEHSLTSNLDLTHMAAEALGANFELMDKRQFAEFSREYSRFLTYLYLQEISWVKQDGGDFEIVAAKLDSKNGGVALQTRAAMRSSMANVSRRRRGSYPSSLEGSYRMKKERGQWIIMSIRFNGVDLNRVFGAQFAALLEKRSPESLIEELQERNAENAKRNPFEKKKRGSK